MSVKVCPICGDRYIVRSGLEDRGLCKKHFKCERCGKLEDRTPEHRLVRYCEDCRKVIKSENAKRQYELKRAIPKKTRHYEKPDFTIDELCKIRNALDLPNHLEIIQKEIKKRGIKIVRGKVVETWPQKNERP